VFSFGTVSRGNAAERVERTATCGIKCSLIGCLHDRANIEKTSNKLRANFEQTSSKHGANIELAQAGLLEPRPWLKCRPRFKLL